MTDDRWALYAAWSEQIRRRAVQLEAATGAENAQGVPEGGPEARTVLRGRRRLPRRKRREG